MSPTLYQLGQDLAEIQQMLIESEGEVTPEIQERLDRQEFLEADKIDAYYAVLREFEAQETKYREEAQRLHALAQHQQKAQDVLKANLRRYMEIKGVTQLVGEFKTVKVVKNGGLPPLDLLVPEPSLPDPYVTKTANKALLRAEAQHCEDGIFRWEGIPLAKLGERGTSLRWS